MPKPYLYPHPLKPGVMVTRQRIYQLRRQAEGKCVLCGRKARKGTTLCLLHARFVKRQNPTREQWAKVDWGKSAKQIALEMGVTVVAVYQQRKKINNQMIQNWKTLLRFPKLLPHLVQRFRAEADPEMVQQMLLQWQAEGEPDPILWLSRMSSQDIPP